MLSYKLNIFTNAVITRVDSGEGTVEEIVATYTKLTVEEQQEVITNVYLKRPDLEMV